MRSRLDVVERLQSGARDNHVGGKKDALFSQHGGKKDALFSQSTSRRFVAPDCIFTSSLI